VQAPSPSRLDRYLRHRVAWEIAVLVAFFGAQAIFNATVVDMEFARTHADVQPWEPFVWEFTSAAVLLALLPALLAFDRRYPLRAGTLRANLPRHLLASVVYSVVHVVAMFALRVAIYAVAGHHYAFFSPGPWSAVFTYEYLKDIRTYFVSIAVIYAYRFVLLRLQGEASLLAAPDEGLPVEPIERPERFLVRKLGKEFLVAADDIEWLQAEGNYVNLHVKGRLYPLRSTMTALEPRLDPLRFIRVHRSYMVNLEHLVEIEPIDSGDARLRLRDGTLVPCSRRYRAALRARGGLEVAADPIPAQAVLAPGTACRRP
jgi:hypothetical protein